MSDADIAAEATATLRAMFGADNVPDALGCAHSTWGSDPFARGSWSYFPYRADSSSFDPGNGVPGVETVSAAFERTSVCLDGDGAIVGSAREGQDSLEPAVVVGQAGGADDSSSSRLSSCAVVTSVSVTAAADPLSVSASCLSATSTATVATTSLATAITATEDSSCVPSETAVVTTTIAIASLETQVRPRAVTISQAASSVLGGLGYSVAPRSPVRKYSDFGCTSDGTEDSGSSSDEDEEVVNGGAMAGHYSDSGATTMSSASSSDEPASFKRGAGSTTGAQSGPGGRSLDDVISMHLYYASEAMSVQNRGTVHGAYKSGIREATKILAFLDETRAK